MSLRLTSLVLSLLLAFGCVHARPTGDQELRSAEDAPRPLLWAASKGGAESYLLGTMHVGVDPRKDLDEGVWRRFREAPCFVMEADPAAVSFPDVMAMARQPAGRTLQSQIAPRSWRALTEALPSVPAAVLDGSEAWFAALLYLQSRVPSGPVMDHVLLEEARRAGKRIEFLEDWREAMSALSGAIDATDLEELVTSGDKLDRQLAEMRAAYLSGDPARLAAILDGATADRVEAEAKLNRLLAARNRVWLPRLTATLARGPCFVAVGAGHLVGRDDLLGLLEGAGYATRRVTQP